MKKAAIALLGVSVLACGAVLMAAEEPTPHRTGIPEGARGFRGMVSGMILEKNPDRGRFVLKVEHVGRVWKESKASNPQSLAGQEIAVVIDRGARKANDFLATLRELKAGDRVEVELFPAEGDTMKVMEVFHKVGATTQPRMTDERDQQIQRLKQRVSELEKQVQRLKAENAELREKLENSQK